MINIYSWNFFHCILHRKDYPPMLKTQYWWKIPNGPFSHSRSHMGQMEEGRALSTVSGTLYSEMLDADNVTVWFVIALTLQPWARNGHIVKLSLSNVCLCDSNATRRWTYIYKYRNNRDQTSLCNRHCLTSCRDVFLH